MAVKTCNPRWCSAGEGSVVQQKVVQQKADGNAIEGSATVGIVVQQKVAHPSLPVTLSGTLCSEWGCSTVLG
jgi:hypothetical protein